ncbi:hypothetical protein CHUV0807_2174 [Cardiobacterium hominis]|uniref:Uncharacterized protein n=1 Tax=Cardiobacterium hominis TaxID=2718 RepID=A0A1C3H6J6_9GAMM|nr:hypothetical protein CHUV0807_2174 [Cardiobacterium hominis]
MVFFRIFCCAFRREDGRLCGSKVYWWGKHHPTVIAGGYGVS